MTGALASLAVCAGLAASAPAPSAPVLHDTPTLCAPTSDVAACMAPARPNSHARRVLGDVATPAEIGCALVFATTPSHRSGDDKDPCACGEPRPVWNAWYRVSRYPDAEGSPTRWSATAPATSRPQALGRDVIAPQSDGPVGHDTFSLHSQPLALVAAAMLPPPSMRARWTDATPAWTTRALRPPDRPPRAQA